MQVEHLRKYLHLARVNHKSNLLEELYERFLGEIDRSSGAVSACGFVMITREYVATVRDDSCCSASNFYVSDLFQMVGALLSFIILVYQTRDSKVDMRSLLQNTLSTPDLQRCNCSDSADSQLSMVLHPIASEKAPMHLMKVTL